MKSVIHPDYAPLSNELAELIQGHYTPEKTFCNKRNTVELVNVAGKPMVMKRYKKANLLTGIIYTLFRKSKARRAYEHALLLLNAGIATPKPIAYAEKRCCGIFHYGYFISEYCTLPSVESEFYAPEADRQEHQKMAEALSRYTLELHQKGFIPLDYNTTNILFEKVNGEYRFTLIDINRMKFRANPGIKDAMRSFFQLGTYPTDYFSLLGYYVNQRGFDFEESLFNVIRHRHHQTRLRKFKKFFKKFWR
jgi:hypothetical protein